MKHVKQLLDFLGAHHIDYKNASFLVGVSGGLDSMVLATMFVKAKLSFGVAHCNFSLRGEESDSDEEFVMDYFRSLKVPGFSVRFDTSNYADEHRLGIQEAARELRYRFFKQTANHQGYDFIVTAHHLNDNVETMLLNLGSGTGLRGIKGIPPINGNIIRPLIGFSRQEIISFAKSYAVPFREDSSNISLKYSRNALRHKIIPELGNIKPGFLEKCAASMSLLHAQLRVYDYFVDEFKKKLLTIEAGQLKINISTLMGLPEPYVMLYECLQDLGFRNAQCREMTTAIGKGQSGKMWYSETHEVLLDRECFIVRIKAADKDVRIFIGENAGLFREKGFEISLEISATFDFSTPARQIYVDGHKLSYPLLLRRWQPGDLFHPLGMMGKRKKVKSYLSDAKLSLFDKEEVYVLESKGKIVWLVGFRQDERFIPFSGCKKIVCISIDHYAKKLP